MARTLSRTLRTAVAVTALSLIVAACGNGDTADPTPDPTSPPTGENGEQPDSDPVQALYEAALEEGELMWYSSQVPGVNDLTVQRFMEAYPGIEVEWFRLASVALAGRYVEELSAGSVVADLITVPTEAFAESGTADGYFLELNEALVPSLANWPEEFFHFGTAPRMSIQLIKATYNTDLVEEGEITSWEDLLDERWTGNILFVDPRISMSWMALMNVWYEELGPEVLEGFGAQNPTLVESAVPGVEQLTAGAFEVLLPSLDSVIAGPVADGAPLANVALNPTTGVEQYTMISADAPSPNAARLFMHWLLTEDGQEAHNQNMVSPLGAFTGTEPLPDDYSPPRASYVEAEMYDELVRLLGL